MISIRRPGEHTNIERSLLNIFKMDVTLDTIGSTDLKDFMRFISGEYKDCSMVVSWRSNVLEVTGEQDQCSLVNNSERLQTVG